MGAPEATAVLVRPKEEKGGPTSHPPRTTGQCDATRWPSPQSTLLGGPLWGMSGGGQCLGRPTACHPLG